MGKANGKKYKSTYEREMANPRMRQLIEEETRAVAIQELMLALMAEDEVSVRALAKLAGISKTVIQDLRSGHKKNPTIQNFTNIIHALGAQLQVTKGKRVLATL